MAVVLFVELPSASNEAAAGNRGGFFLILVPAETCAPRASSGKKVALGVQEQNQQSYKKTEPGLAWLRAS